MTTEHKYFTVEGDPVIVGELYERRDGVVVRCAAIDEGDSHPVFVISIHDGTPRSHRNDGYTSFMKRPDPSDLMRRHVPAVVDHSGDDTEMVQAVAKGIADAFPDTWRHEAFMDLVSIAAEAAIAAVRKFEGKSDGK